MMGRRRGDVENAAAGPDWFTTPMNERTRTHRWKWKGRSELRLLLAIAAGVLAVVIAELTGRADVPAMTSWGNRVGLQMLVAWDVLALTFTILTWAELWRMSPDQTEQDADREEPPVDVVMMLIVSGAVASLGVVGFLMTQKLAVWFGIVTVVISWFAVHTLFALTYARIYFSEKPSGGIDFNKTGYRPQYSDFAYVAYTVGMSFAISDTNLTSPEMRKAALAHGLLSFVFGSVIVASVVNVIGT